MIQLTTFYPDFDYSLAHTYQLLDKWQISYEHPYLFYQELFSKITNKHYTLHSNEFPNKDFFELIYLFCAIYRDSYSPFVTDALDELSIQDEDAYIHQSLIDFIDSLYQLSQLPSKYESLLQHLPSKSVLNKHTINFTYPKALLDTIITLYKTALKNLSPSLTFSEITNSFIRDNLINMLSIIDASPSLKKISPIILCLFFIQYRSKLTTEAIDTPSFAIIFKKKDYNFSSVTSKSHNIFFTYWNLFLTLCEQFELSTDETLLNTYIFEEQTHLYSWVNTMLFLENMDSLMETDYFELIDELKEAPTLEKISVKMLLSPLLCFYTETTRYASVEFYNLELNSYEHYTFDYDYEKDVLTFLRNHPEFHVQYITYYFNNPKKIAPLITQIFKSFISDTDYELPNKKHINHVYLHTETLLQQLLEEDLLSKFLQIF